MTTESKLAMFRAAIGLTWADGKLSDAEREKLKNYINKNVNLAEDQRAQLLKDLDNPMTVDEVWEKITDKEDRAHLINIAEGIFWADGEYCSSEKEMYEKIFNTHSATLDTKQLQAELGEMLIEARKNWAREEQEYLDSLKKVSTGIPGTFDLEMLFYKIDKALDKFSRK